MRPETAIIRDYLKTRLDGITLSDSELLGKKSELQAQIAEQEEHLNTGAWKFESELETCIRNIRNCVQSALNCAEQGVVDKALLTTADIRQVDSILVTDILSNDCASLQWSQVIQDVPDDVSEALETIQCYTESRLGAFCAEGRLVRTLSEDEETLWHQCTKRSGIVRQILGSCVILAGKESQMVQEALAEAPEAHFITEELSGGQNLVLL